MSVTRRNLLKGAAAVGAVTLADPLARPAQAQTTQKRELVVGQGGDVAHFDPHMSTSSNEIRVSFNIFDNLLSRHPDGKLHPALATEWKLEGQTTWRFKLRQGVKFHNGDPFTSADAKCEHRAHLRPQRQDAGQHRPHHHRPDRGARPDDAGHPHQEARSAAGRAPGLLRRPDRAQEVPRDGGRRRLQQEARGHRPGPLRLVDQGRPARARSERRLLGRQAGLRPADGAAHPRAGRARRRGRSRARST